MNDQQSSGRAEHADPVMPPDAALRLRRRRLLKIGAGAAPASLLLVGRPVHALSCSSTSAWGSAQLAATASVTAGKVGDVGGWTLAQWVEGSVSGRVGYVNEAPWRALNTAMKAQQPCSEGWKKGLKISDVVVVPKGLTTTDTCYDVLNKTGKCTGATEFQQLMLVALLNQRALAGTANAPAQCVPEADLREMASGTYRAGTGTVWLQPDIVLYLKSNNIARLS